MTDETKISDLSAYDFETKQKGLILRDSTLLPQLLDALVGKLRRLTVSNVRSTSNSLVEVL